jgi:hypothetical protein
MLPKFGSLISVLNTFVGNGAGNTVTNLIENLSGIAEIAIHWTVIENDFRPCLYLTLFKGLHIFPKYFVVIDHGIDSFKGLEKAIFYLIHRE